MIANESWVGTLIVMTNYKMKLLNKTKTKKVNSKSQSTAKQTKNTSLKTPEERKALKTKVCRDKLASNQAGGHFNLD